MSLLVLLVALAQAPAPPIRVYFAGNSLTFRNDLPGLVAELGRSLDPPVLVEIGMSARDGMTLERHWREGAVLQRLREERWDVLVLQEQGSMALTNPALMEDYVRRFSAAARDAGAEVILFQTWGRDDRPETEPRRAETYRRVANETGVRLAPVGEAWRRAHAALPRVVLHADDGLHASRAGTYLASAVLLGMLTGRSPEEARPLKSGDPDSAAALRALAWSSVIAAEDSKSSGP